MTTMPALSTIYGRLVLVAAMGGGTFIAARVSSAPMTAPMAALWRYVIATLALLALSFVVERGLPRLSRAQWGGVGLLGATGVMAYNLCFMFGMETVSASRGSLIIATVPAATLLGGALFLHEPLTLRRVVGVLIALLGVGVGLGRGSARNSVRAVQGSFGRWRARAFRRRAFMGGLHADRQAAAHRYVTVGSDHVRGAHGNRDARHRVRVQRRPRAAACHVQGLDGIGVHGRLWNGHCIYLVLRRREGDRPGAVDGVRQSRARLRDHLRDAAARRKARAVDGRGRGACHPRRVHHQLAGSARLHGFRGRDPLTRRSRSKCSNRYASRARRSRR